jgi:hypothetical protein
MRSISQSEGSAAHRIFNHVDELRPYHGHKTLDQALEYVSLNRWIMFPVKGINSLREGTDCPMPNVFVAFDDEVIQDDGTGKVTEGFMGVTFHNVSSMVNFDEILKRKSKSQKFMEILRSFHDDWSIEIQRKTSTNCPGSTPQYDVFEPVFKPSQVTVPQLINARRSSDQTLLQFGDTYPITGNPVMWSVTIFTITKETNQGVFDADIMQCFDAFFKLLIL